VDNWPALLGFTLSSEHLRSDLKQRAIEYIKKAFARNADVLHNSLVRVEKDWNKINNKFFIELEKFMKFKPSRSYDCYLSLVTKFGFHNTPKNFIIINHKLAISNYVVAHEIFAILFRQYVKRYFKEDFDDLDENLQTIITLMVLLDHPQIKTCFPKKEFSLSLYSEKHLELAKHTLKYWREHKSFKEFMINLYSGLGVKKTWISY
jgi:hypothetical protein